MFVYIHYIDKILKTQWLFYPIFKAVYRSCSLTIAPLDVFTRKDVLFIVLNASISNIYLVSSVRGICKVIISESFKSLSKSTNLTPSSLNSSFILG